MGSGGETERSQCAAPRLQRVEMLNFLEPGIVLAQPEEGRNDSLPADAAVLVPVEGDGSKHFVRDRASSGFLDLQRDLVSFADKRSMPR